MNEASIVVDLHILASVCVRQRLSVYSLCLLTLLYRRPGLYVSQVVKYTGMSQSDVYNRMRYLESKGLVVRRYEQEHVRALYSWDLAEEGKMLVREYETCYRKLHRWLIDRW